MANSKEWSPHIKFPLEIENYLVLPSTCLRKGSSFVRAGMPLCGWAEAHMYACSRKHKKLQTQKLSAFVRLQVLELEVVE